MDIAIIGAGSVGAALGKGWAKAGHSITYGVSRPGDAKYAPAAAAAGGAPLVSNKDAAARASVIVLATPWNATADAIAACGDLAGKIVIDATNPLTMTGGKLSLALGFDRSGAELVASLAKGASVFKAMNQIGAELMVERPDYPAKPCMFVAGDNAAGKTTVLGLVADLGFEAIDAGSLQAARLIEPMAMLWIHMAFAQGAGRRNAFAYMRG